MTIEFDIYPAKDGKSLDILKEIFKGLEQEEPL